MKKLLLIALVIVACLYAYKLGVDSAYRQLENELQMCIMRVN